MPKKAAGGYVRKNAAFKKLERKGDFAEGYLIGVTVIEFEPKKAGDLPGRAPKFTFKALTSDERFSVLAGSTVLDDAVALKIGARTKVIYGGTTKTNKGYNAGVWELLQDESDMADAD